MRKLFIFSLLLALSVSCEKHAGWKLAPGIYILDKKAPVRTYAELKARLPCQAIYVDRWATWCDPCIEEFAYYDSLRPFLEANGIEVLYLNSDMDIGEKQWFDFIKAKKLYGYHVRLNKELQRDLIDQKIYLPRIPQFMILDSSGSVLNKQALRPSNGMELRDQLMSILGKQAVQRAGH